MLFGFKKFLKHILIIIRKIHSRAALALVMALVLLMLLPAQDIFTAYGADSDEISDELEEAIEEADSLQEKIDDLNDTLSSLSSEIEELAAQIAEAEEDLTALEEEISLAEAEADEQYESLLAWIQVSYENDFDTLFMSVMSAGSFSEVLAQAEYIQSLSQFGQDLMERYNETLTELEAQKESLNEALARLEALEDETSQKKTEISEAISDTQNELSDANSEIDSLEEQLEEQLEYEAQLQAAKAAEEEARIAQILEEEAANTSEAVISTDSADLTLLAALIYCEAGGSTLQDQIAVGCVVMNRVRSSSFPDTVSGVIYQSGQFPPATSGRLAAVIANDLTTDSCYEAAAYVLAGNLPYPDFLYFCSASVSLSISTTVIGDNQFY